MKTCKTCKHWWTGLTLWGECQGPDHHPNGGIVQISAEFDSDDSNENEPDHEILFHTREDFGCILHEEKN